ncbi:MAG: hypothetical protein U1A78_30575 [Polyangia bacterium]
MGCSQSVSHPTPHDEQPPDLIADQAAGLPPPDPWDVVANPGSGGHISGIWGSGPDDIWFVGLPSLHWDGTSLTPVPLRATAVWGSGPDDVWAVGFGSHCQPGTIGPVPSSIYHRSGGTWTLSFSYKTSLCSVWGSGPNDVWAVGDSEQSVQRGGVLHWDGTAWTRQAINTHYLLVGVTGIGPNEAYFAGGLVGSITDPEPRLPRVARWDGTSWTGLTSGPTVLNGLVASGPGEVWLASWGSLCRLEGSRCVEFPIEGDNSLGTAISGWSSSPSDVWFVGSGGFMVHWDGTTLRRVPSGTDQTLYAIWGSGPDDIWAAGDSGVILHKRPVGKR